MDIQSVIKGRTTKILAATAFSVSAVLLTYGVWAESENRSNMTLACDCDANVEYNNRLPASHPNNRCALPEHDVSWKNWISGKSRSNQFHFLDLIELWHGHQDKPLNDLPANNPNQM